MTVSRRVKLGNEGGMKFKEKKQMTYKTNTFSSLARSVVRVGLLCFCLFAATETISAQEKGDEGQEAQKKTMRSYKAFGAGFCKVQDTYLSPEEYKGTELRYLSHTIREREGKKWASLIINEGYGAMGNSRSENGATLSGAYHFMYGRMRAFSLFDGKMKVWAGAQGELTLGMIYNTRNGNNPAQAIANIDFGGLVRAEYPVKKVLLSYEATCPLLGVTFSPNCGQSYYEIFNEGNYDHNLVPTTIFSVPSLRHTIAAELPIGKTKCIFGIYGDYRQQQVNNLKRHIYTSGVMIGLVRNIK